MAKKKTPPAPSRRSTGLTIRMTPEYRAWLNRGAVSCRLTVSDLIDQAVVLFLHQRYREPPPPR